MVAEDIPADTGLVRCYQSNQSLHVVTASVGEAADSADFCPSATTSAAAGHHRITAPFPPDDAEAASSPLT